jgi:hypothetical protein
LYENSKRNKGAYTADNIKRIAPPRDLVRDLVDVKDVMFAVARPVREVGMLAVRLSPEETLVRVSERRVLNVLEHNDVTIRPDLDIVICRSYIEPRVGRGARMNRRGTAQVSCLLLSRHVSAQARHSCTRLVG